MKNLAMLPDHYDPFTITRDEKQIEFYKNFLLVLSGLNCGIGGGIPVKENGSFVNLSSRAKLAKMYDGSLGFDDLFGAFSSGEGRIQDLLAMVKIFHMSFGHPWKNGVDLKFNGERIRRRCEWMTEEVNEIFESTSDTTKGIVGIVDGCMDLLYFTLGTLVELGINNSAIPFQFVHHANMNKFNEDGTINYNEFGKIVKPSEWRGPEENIVLYLVQLYLFNAVKNDYFINPTPSYVKYSIERLEKHACLFVKKFFGNESFKEEVERIASEFYGLGNEENITLNSSHFYDLIFYYAICNLIDNSSLFWIQDTPGRNEFMKRHENDFNKLPGFSLDVLNKVWKSEGVKLVNTELPTKED